MERFAYVAYDRSGVRHSGRVTAADERSARIKIKDKGLIPVRLAPLGRFSTQEGRLQRLLAGGPPGLSDVEFTTAQLALLLDNGVRIDRALETLVRAVRRPAMKQVLRDVRDQVRAGVPLSKALERHPQVFDGLYVSVVTIGEATGRLPQVLESMAANLAFRKSVRARTRQAMAYPAVILAVCLLALVFIFNFVVPRFETLMARMASPPLPARMLMAASHGFQDYQWILLGALAVVPLVWRRLSRLPVFRERLDGVWLRLPLTRGLILTLENLRFASAMGVLLQSGVLLVDALDHAVRAVGNSNVRRRLLSVRHEVKQGRSLSAAMAPTAFFPEIYAGILEVGEQAGTLARVFRDLESRMRADYETRLNTLITLVEPAMIVFMGITVGSIVVTMLLSTVSLQQMAF